MFFARGRLYLVFKRILEIFWKLLNDLGYFFGVSDGLGLDFSGSGGNFGGRERDI